MMKIQGQVEIRRGRPSIAGRPVVFRGANLVVDAGYALIAGLFNASQAPPSHVALGSSGAANSRTMIALQGTEYQRNACTVSVNGNLVTVAASITNTSGADRQIKEVGIFNAAAAGTMLARLVTSEFTFAVADNLDFNWSITIGD